MEEDRQKKKFSYKWIVIGLCFMLIFVCLGFGSSTNQLFVKPVTEHLNVARSAFSITQSIRFIVVSIVNLFFGLLIVKFGAKKLIIAGVACLASAMLIFHFSESLLGFYAGGIFIGLGFAWTGTAVVGYTVNIWEKEKTGTVMGAILAANGLGGAVAMQVVSPIIHASDVGYKTAYLVIAIIFAVLGVLIAVFFKDKPKNYSGTIAHVKKKGRGNSWEGIDFKNAVKQPYFYVAIACVFLTGLALQGVNGISAVHMEDVGIDPAYVATVLSVHSIMLAVFKFLTGFFYDKFGLRFVSCLCYAAGIIVMFMLAFVTNNTTGMVLSMVYGVFSSLSLPLETIMLPIYAKSLFGEKSFAKIMGLLIAVNTAGYAVGGPLTNLCYDLVGSYRIALFIGSAIMLVAFTVMQYALTAANKIKNSLSNSVTETAQEDGIE